MVIETLMLMLTYWQIQEQAAPKKPFYYAHLRISAKCWAKIQAFKAERKIYGWMVTYPYELWHSKPIYVIKRSQKK